MRIAIHNRYTCYAAKKKGTIRPKTKKQTWCSITRRIDNKSAMFPLLVDTRGWGSRVAARRTRASSCSGPATRSLHTISSLSRRHTGACDQPLQNLQRIHYHVSGCSASRDHVPILYDILYWGGGGGGGWWWCCAEFHGSRSERTGSSLRSGPPSRENDSVPCCLGAPCHGLRARFEFHILTI